MVLIPLVSGAIGGTVSGFAGPILYDKITKPTLEIQEDVEVEPVNHPLSAFDLSQHGANISSYHFAMDEPELDEPLVEAQRTHYLSIKNVEKRLGHKAANNLRASIEMVGYYSDGVSYHLDTLIRWPVPSRPINRTLNQGETARLAILRETLDNIRRDNGEITTRRHIDIPTVGDNNVESAFTMRSVGESDLLMGSAILTSEQMLEIDWSIFRVVISAENADPVSCSLSFEEEDIDVSDEEDQDTPEIVGTKLQLQLTRE